MNLSYNLKNSQTTCRQMQFMKLGKNISWRQRSLCLPTFLYTFDWQSSYCVLYLSRFSLPTLLAFTASHFATRLHFHYLPFHAVSDLINVMCCHWCIDVFSCSSPCLSFYEGSWKGRDLCSPCLRLFHLYTYGHEGRSQNRVVPPNISAIIEINFHKIYPDGIADIADKVRSAFVLLFCTLLIFITGWFEFSFFFPIRTSVQLQSEQ